MAALLVGSMVLACFGAPGIALLRYLAPQLDPEIKIVEPMKKP